jgi:hypothetical protein
MDSTSLVIVFIVVAGIFALCAACCNWDWFFAARKAGFMVKVIGRTGARVFYGVLGLAIIIYAANQYLHATSLNRNVLDQWAQVQVPLKKRMDLVSGEIGGTTGSVRGEMKDAALAVARARDAYFNATTVNAQVNAANDMDQALVALFQQQQYASEPNKGVRALQVAFDDTEGPIAAAAEKYNDAADAVQEYTLGAARIFFRQEFAALAGVPNEDITQPYLHLFNRQLIEIRLKNMRTHFNRRGY